jgi:gliding motility-associated-like protein
MLVVGNGNGYDTAIHYSAVNVSSVPTATVHGDTTMAFGGRDTLSASGGISYFWFVPGNSDSTSWGLDTNFTDTVVATPQYTTTYYVLITDAAGCHTYRQVTVVITRHDRVYIPNAFAPEAGREPNATFRIFGNNIYSAKLVVFDRWGEKVFETDNKDVGWDGTYKGKKLNAGVYTYYAAVIFDNPASQPEIQTGTIALIR